jgi:hypothetical protein
MTSDEIVDALEERYAPPEWATLLEVYDKTSTAGKRRADMVAINCFRSRGWEIHGIEIKVSASDLTREIQNPRKAEEVGKYCDRWWIAIPHEMAKDRTLDKVPATWGIIVVQRTKSNALRTRALRKAEKLEPVPLTRGFVAAVVRRASERLALFRQMEAKAANVEQLRKESFEKGEQLAKEMFDLERREHTQLQEKVATFERISGIKLNRAWEIENVGETVRALMPFFRSGRLDFIRNRILQEIQSLKSGLALIDQGRMHLRAPKHTEGETG